jgi:pyruvate kinase
MVARGDLGIEVSYEELPIVQRRIVKHCLLLGRPVIVATHMLESMIDAPSPTRAEVTDVANAVFEQADAVMLSGETSIGKYPIKCMEVMDRIARRIERSGGAGYADAGEMTSNREKIARYACTLAETVGAAALLVFTRQGRTAAAAARFRPLKVPIFAFTNNPKLVNQLALLWGTEPVFMDFYDQDPGENVQKSTEYLLHRGVLTPGDTVIVMTEVKSRGKMLNTIQLETV